MRIRGWADFGGNRGAINWIIADGVVNDVSIDRIRGIGRWIISGAVWECLGGVNGCEVTCGGP